MTLSLIGEKRLSYGIVGRPYFTQFVREEDTEDTLLIAQ
jgi:hypothetical protein